MGIPFNGVFVINLGDLITMGSHKKSDVLYFDERGPFVFSDGNEIRKIDDIPRLKIIIEGDEIQFEDISEVNRLLLPKNLQIEIKKISELIGESDKNTSLVSFSSLSPSRKTFII